MNQSGEPASHTVPDAQSRIAELERKIGQQQLGSGIFRAALQQVRGTTPTDRRAFSMEGVHAVIQATTQQQGNLGIERMWVGRRQPGRATQYR